MNTLILLAAAAGTGMIHSLIVLLIVALVLVVIYYVVAMFIDGKPLKIIGLILGLVLLLYALNLFNILA